MSNYDVLFTVLLTAVVVLFVVMVVSARRK
jgi:hypothetical protein